MGETTDIPLKTADDLLKGGRDILRESHESVPQKTPRVKRKKKSKSQLYSFLPGTWHKKTILLWLRRTHAWCGFWGAMVALLFGLSGFVLNHRGGDLKLNIAGAEVQDIKLAVAVDQFTKIDELAAWMKEKYAINMEATRRRITKSKQVIFENQIVMSPEKWEVRFQGPKKQLRAKYAVGSSNIDLSVRESNIWAMMNSLHKGNGLSIGWVLFADSIAGCLILLCISGMLLWTKFHGTRVFAMVLFIGAIGACLALVLPGMIAYSI